MANQADGKKRKGTSFVLEAGGFFVAPSKAWFSNLLDVTNPTNVQNNY